MFGGSKDTYYGSKSSPGIYITTMPSFDQKGNHNNTTDMRHFQGESWSASLELDQDDFIKSPRKNSNLGFATRMGEIEELGPGRTQRYKQRSTREESYTSSSSPEFGKSMAIDWEPPKQEKNPDDVDDMDISNESEDDDVNFDPLKYRQDNYDQPKVYPPKIFAIKNNTINEMSPNKYIPVDLVAIELNFLGPWEIHVLNENTGSRLYNNGDFKRNIKRLCTQQISFSPSKYPRVSIVASLGYPKKYKKWSIKLTRKQHK